MAFIILKPFSFYTSLMSHWSVSPRQSANSQQHDILDLYKLALDQNSNSFMLTNDKGRKFTQEEQIEFMKTFINKHNKEGFDCLIRDGFILDIDQDNKDYVIMDDIVIKSVKKKKETKVIDPNSYEQAVVE